MTPISAVQPRESAIEARRQELLTVKEFATLSRVHPFTVYRRIWRHQQPGVVRFGREIRIDLSAILAEQAAPV